jgi:branched-chain amino acid transport system permease protein
VVIGLASGGVYASLALALVLVYRASGVVNFAQGEMGLLATYLAWTLVDAGIPYWGAFFATLAVAFAGGVAVERAVVRPVESAPVLTVVIVTIGLLIALNGLAGWIFGPEVRSFPSAFPSETVDVGGVVLSVQNLGVVAVSLAVVGLLWAFFSLTRLGLAMRAAAMNRESSRLLGIRVGWMLALAWGLASALGALSGMLVAPIVFLDPTTMQSVLLYALAAAVLGGLESPGGAVAGGLLIGVLVNLLGTYVGAVSSELQLVVAFGVILLFLLVRPAGLFGRAEVRRV